MLRLQLAGDVSRLDFSPFVRLIPKAARSYQGTAMALTYVSGEFANSLAFNGSFDIDLGGQTLSGDVRFAGERLIPGRELDSTLQYYVIRFTIIQKDLDLYSLSVVRGPESSPGTTTTLNFDYKPSAPESFVSGEYSSVSTRYFSTTPIVSQSALASSVISPNPIPVCFTTGTLIRTARGEVAVEDLIVGDLAVTASGALRPITWIGYRRLEHLAPEQQPVRVRTGAFGSSLPVRDLFLSAGHPVLVGADANGEGGVLVPVMCLINGTSIAREPATQVTYWHVELDTHDILLAEGLAAESYIDGGDRAFFAEASDHALHNPDFVPAGWSARCRPVAVDGALVERERARLDAVFADVLTAHSGWDETHLPA